MRTLFLTLTLTNVLLVMGIVGTVIGITHLVYPSQGRHHRRRQRKRAWAQTKKTTEQRSNDT